MASQFSALILGATGQTGGQLLKKLLSSPHFTQVHEYGRRVTPKESLDVGADKLEQKKIDFEKLEESGLSQGKWNVVYITLGTTRSKAGSAQAFEKIDREYVINAAKEARNPSVPQRLVYVSAFGSDPESPFLYPRSKALTEQGLAALGYDETIVLRPGFLSQTNRGDHRILEGLLGIATAVLSYVSPNWEIPISTLAEATLTAGRVGSAGIPAEVQTRQEGKEGAKFTVISNAGALKLAELSKNM